MSCSTVDVSVVVPVVDVYGDLSAVCSEFGRALEQGGRSYEFLFVLDPRARAVVELLGKLRREDQRTRVVLLGTSLGVSAALRAGIHLARGSYIMTLAPYLQVGGEAVARAFEALEAGADLVVVRRHPRVDSLFNRLQSKAFHWLVRWLTGCRFRDLSCGFRLGRRPVFEEMRIYGELHRFIPVLAQQDGFRVTEIAVPQRQEERHVRLFSPRVYAGRVLDIAGLFFLSHFTRKPLRFFGSVGGSMFVAGAAICAYLAAYRLLGYGAIGDRPLLLLGLLLVVFGMQLISIGLVGEIIVYTHLKEPEYRVEKVL